MDKYAWKYPSLCAISDAIREFFPDGKLPLNAIMVTDILLAITDAKTIKTLNVLSDEARSVYKYFDDAGKAKIREIGTKRRNELTAQEKQDA